ncbi:MAG: pentapeptide repeat-containing protein [Candidatus Edwardsbacteria bacterium]|nr:pentapeptide repeat-containing protein [Candidatus Edwardsbacteria bacterium]MBU2595022.1 pentapeptide repeat-containing protein [Candidatus Edwardsbacteria bacterium]
MTVLKKLIITLLIIITLFSAYLIIKWAANPYNAPQWTGFSYIEHLSKDYSVVKTRTLWDWFSLLIVPVAISLSVFLLSKAEKTKDREIEDDRQRQNALESYFDYMGMLLLEKNLLNSKANSEVHCLSRTRTLLLFKYVDKLRKARALQFIYEAGLISKNPIINLKGAKFIQADFSNAVLDGIEIRGAYFCKTNLKGAIIRNSILCGCDFSGANLEECDFSNSDLTYANFKGAKTKGMVLKDSNIKWTKDLKGR